MKEEMKTKKQLLSELSELRQRLAQLEISATPGDRFREEHYRLLFEGNADGYAAVDKEGYITESNPAFRKMVEYSEAELRGMTYKDLSPERWHESEDKIIEEQIRTGSYSAVYEKEYRRKDGVVIPVELRTYLLNDKREEYAGLWAVIRDISERRQTEEVLRTSEERFYKAFQSSPAPTFISTISEGRYIDVNDSGLKLLGYDRKEIIGHTSRELAIWSAYADRESLMKTLLRDGYIHNKSIFLRTKTGVIIETLWSCEIIIINNEEVMLSLLYDITERKQAEEALRGWEQLLMHIFDFLPDATLVIDLEGKVIAWNRAIEEMTGVKAQEVLGKGNYEYAIPFYGRRRPIMADIILHQDANITPKNYSVLDKQRDLMVAESWVPKLKGARAFLWAKASLLYDGKGNVAGAIESIRDVTDRKRAEENLQESQRRLADIIDFLPDATFAIDLRGKVIAWNRAIEEMTGVDVENMLGKGDFAYAVPFYGEKRPMMIDIVLKPNKKIELSYDSLVKKEQDILLLEHWVPKLKGARAFLWGKASPLYDSKGNTVGAIESIRDVTDRKRAEEALKKREEDLALKTRELEDLNVALRVLLKQREGDQRHLGEAILSNVKLLIEPFVEKLKNHADPKGASYIKVIQSNLQDIISPFSRQLSTKYLNLTNKEIQVAGLIKEEKTTKEIADLLNISVSAVSVHRYHIRKKVGLTKSQNLRLYLSSLA
jgi:PAS domain S-box-containing protein